MNPAQKKSDSVLKKHGPFFERLIAEAVALAEAPGPLEDRARRMLEITDDLAGKVARKAICRRGCSYCCHQSVIVSSWEAKRIARFTGRAARQFRAPQRGDDLHPTQRRYLGIPCPFLKRGECSVYAVRPMACRMHFSMEADPAPCNIANDPGGRVALFNFRSLMFPQAMLFLNDGCSFADLRDYFPPVPAPQREPATEG